jgi:hypothetical protein
MKRVLCLLLAITVPSCATILRGSKQAVAISWTQPGAKVTVDGEPLAAPGEVELSRRGGHVVKATAGGRKYVAFVQPERSAGWTTLQVLSVIPVALTIIGSWIVISYVSQDGCFTLDPDPVQIDFENTDAVEDREIMQALQPPATPSTPPALARTLAPAAPDGSALPLKKAETTSDAKPSPESKPAPSPATTQPPTAAPSSFAEPAKPSPAVSTPPKAEQPKPRFCGQCGKRFEGDGKFCPECGAPR